MEALSIQKDIELATDKDILTIYLNKLGFIKLNTLLPEKYRSKYDPNDLPNMFMKLSNKTLPTIVEIEKLFPFIKGLELKLIAPHNQRRLVGFITRKILAFIDRKEISHVENIISELIANAEKSNLESIIEEESLEGTLTKKDLLLEYRKDLIKLAIKKNKHVKISWKFSKDIFKVEIANNTPIDSNTAKLLRERSAKELINLAEGLEDKEDVLENKLGAGLGLFLIKFFSDDLKSKGFETLFRIYSSEVNTYATLTIFFEKP